MPRSAEKKKIVGVDFSDNVWVFYNKLDARIYTRDDVRRLMEKCAEMGANAILWRTASTGAVTYRSRIRTRIDQRIPSPARPISLLPQDSTFVRARVSGELDDARCWSRILTDYDPPEAAVDAAREHGLEIHLYTTLFDEAFPNAESAFCLEHPEFCWRHRHFDHYNRALLAFGYPEVRDYKLAEVKELVNYGADGVYLDCARSHAGVWPLICLPYGYDVYANYGFNDPECAEYQRQTGTWSRLSNLGKVELEKIDWQLWQRVRGQFLTDFIRRASGEVRRAGQKLGVGFYTDAKCYLSPTGERGRQILGGLHIDCDAWIAEDLVDLIILIAEHRRFGWPDWENHSAPQFADAQERGIDVCLWAATEQGIDELPNPPARLPIRLTENPELLMKTVAENVARCLETTADGVMMYEAAWLEEAELVHHWDYWKHLRQALRA